MSLRAYKFKMSAWSTPGSTLYKGEVIVKAYSLDEAISQFKQTRWTLKPVPLNAELHPLGKECEFTFEAVELEEKDNH